MTRFEKLLEEIKDLHQRKAADYGNDDEPGNFMESRKNESFRDSAIDLAVYSLLLVILYEEEKREWEKT